MSYPSRGQVPQNQTPTGPAAGRYDGPRDRYDRSGPAPPPSRGPIGPPPDARGFDRRHPEVRPPPSLFAQVKKGKQRTITDPLNPSPNSPDLLHVLPHPVSSRAPTLRLSVTIVGVSPQAPQPLPLLFPSLHLSLLLPSPFLSVAAVVVVETFVIVRATTTLVLTLPPFLHLHLHLLPFQARTMKLPRLSVKG